MKILLTLLPHFQLIIFLCSTFLLSCTSQKNSSDKTTMVITNARIWTGNPQQPWAEAIAVRGKIISHVGSTAEILRLTNNATRIYDAGGKMVTPGFIDAHVHFLEGGFRLASVQLRDARTPQEFIRRIKEFAASTEPGTWITGGDWDHEQWGGELPRCDWIDSVTTRHPVWINRLDGHMNLANSLAMKLANVTRETPDIEGGMITRKADGTPTGIFKDNAKVLFENVVPEPSEPMKDKALIAAMRHVAKQGVTSVHHMGSWADLVVFERFHKAGKLKTRIFASVPFSTWRKLKDKVDKEGTGDEMLRIGGLKGFADGSLGSHTAAFFEPFTDEPENNGLLVNTPEDLYQWISAGDKAGLQLLIHAIGDRAINLVLDIYQRVIRENGERDRRFRIEHAQHIAPQDIPRFHDLNVIASMQPYHAIDDGRWAEKVIGAERIKTTYAFRSLLDNGARLAFGSDWFVAPPTPLEGIYAAVTRRTLDGKNPRGWVPEQKITVEEALRAYTADAAYASFEENIKGTLEPGKLADFVIIDRDITQIPPQEIREARIIMTVMGGEIVYECQDKNE